MREEYLKPYILEFILQAEDIVCLSGDSEDIGFEDYNW